MPITTFVPIASYTLDTASTGVTFNPPSGYKNLRLVVSNIKIQGGTDANINFRLNGDSSTIYSCTNFGARTQSATPFSARSSGATYGSISWYIAPGTIAENGIIDFVNYGSNEKYKTILVNTRTDSGSATYSGVEMITNLWRSYNPITSIYVFNVSGYSFAAGSVFTLYGMV